MLIPDIASGGRLANFASVSYAQGGDLVNVEPSLDVITSIKGVKFWRQAEQAVTQFHTGDIYAAVIHAGWCALILDLAQMNRMLKIDYSKANISDWIDQWHRTIAR